MLLSKVKRMEKILENMVDELNQILIMQGRRDNEF